MIKIKKVPKKKPRVFISFKYEDRHAKELLKAQAKNKNIPLYFTQTSLDKPFSSKWKTRMKNTYKNDAVNWKIEQARKMGKKIIGVQIHKGKHHRLPRAL